MITIHLLIHYSRPTLQSHGLIESSKIDTFLTLIDYNSKHDCTLINYYKNQHENNLTNISVYYQHRGFRFDTPSLYTINNNNK